MYYIDRNTVTDAMFLAGSVAEPSAGETLWAPGAHAVGTEVIRTTTHRVYRCAIARTVSDTNPPEIDTNSWADIRPTDRYLPFGPQLRTDGKLVYQNKSLKNSLANIEYRLLQRYANAVAIFGAKGGTWRVQVYSTPGGPMVAEHTGRIRSTATGYWDYAYGQRVTQDRFLIHGLPIYPGAEIRIIIEGTGAQLRAVSQIEVGKLRYIPGITMGGVDYGITRTPRVFTSRKTEEDGSTAIRIYNTSYDMSGTVRFTGKQEDSALLQFRRLLGRGVAFTPTLIPGYQQSLVFGVLKSADVTREHYNSSSARFDIEGLPT